MIFAARRAGIAYRDSWLWLPHTVLNPWAAKASLTFDIAGTNSQILLYQEADNHLIVPREYVALSPKFEANAPLIDLIPEFEERDFTDLMTPRDPGQAFAWQAYAAADNGVLNLGCGKGKTALSCKKIAQRRAPAIVIVNQASLMNQWAEQIHQFLGIPLSDIGKVQGPKFDWEGKSVVLAMIQTLASRADKWPMNFRQYFGTVIFDECHHLSAPMFSRTAPLFWGARYGLSATPNRADALERVYYLHLGDAFYTDMSQELTPRIYFQQLPTEVDMAGPDVRDKFGEFNISRFWAHLAQNVDRNQRIAQHVIQAEQEGRKVLVLGHSKVGLSHLWASIPQAGVVTGDVSNPAERLDTFRNSQVVLATMDVAAEALDAPALDTVFFTTPFKNWRLLIQGMGRALRRHEGKKAPVIVIFEDRRVKPSKGLCRKLKTALTQNGFQYFEVPL